MKKGSGIRQYGIGYRRYSKQSIGIGHHGIVPSLLYTYRTDLGEINIIRWIELHHHVLLTALPTIIKYIKQSQETQK